MNNDTTIGALNEFLRGRYMGVHQLEYLIEQAQGHEDAKRLLQDMQAATKAQAARVAKRIQDLGGVAATDVGAMGRVQEWIQQWKSAPRSAEDILRQAFRGEHKYGIHLSHDIVKGDLDTDSAKLIDDILDEDHRHVDRMHAAIDAAAATAR
ncbi:ferritin-like domain-containing protein [Paenibacillus sp. TRM 82003]|nr:ferritin-like domain-containing protein [Paenibacillus sp. TRM 82003]